LKAEDYPETVRDVLKEMNRQVGVLSIDKGGIAIRGLLVRYLVMPGTSDNEYEQIFSFLAKEISSETYVNIMQQYQPLYKARQYPDIDRPISRDEYNRAIEYARLMGLNRGF